ncbi:MAG TPA: hypothetical protein V6C90_26065 [Coleofasciculaceae cyanobacterium]
MKSSGEGTVEGGVPSQTDKFVRDYSIWILMRANFFSIGLIIPSLLVMSTIVFSLLTLLPDVTIRYAAANEEAKLLEVDSR